MAGIELLAPARDRACGIAAIDCGADAVYIGAPRFGARVAVGNSVDDIAALAQHAHKFWARVYVTLNTLLRDDELPEAVRLAWTLYETGIDALIIQDTGLLECELPPLPLIASTQMHNHTPERVAFLEAAGFARAILARELDLDTIRAIRRAAPRIELECFVHGALCVCYSGQCLLSYALGGRSGNRGECAQPCRKPYTLVDGAGQILVRDRHLLSIRDLNLTDDLPALLDAGVTSFKIEGRLKDRTYVANVVAHYSARLDALGVRRASSGRSSPGFDPDPNKTFNRGSTKYFLHGRRGPIGSHASPKMVGEQMGRVARADGDSIVIEGVEPLHAGDGLCWFDPDGVLRGARVNTVCGPVVSAERPEGLEPGAVVFRNHDHEFLETVRNARPSRRIGVAFTLLAGRLRVRDEDGNEADASVPATLPATQPDAAIKTIRRQLSKTGDTEFTCTAVEIECDPPPFVAVSVLNALRREVLDRLREARAAKRPRDQRSIVPNNAPYPEVELTYLGNVLNRSAEAYYRRHGVLRIEPAAESGLDMRGRKLMTSRYCIKEELGWCPRSGVPTRVCEPLRLVDAEGNRLDLRFDCRRCVMEVYAGTKPA